MKPTSKAKRAKEISKVINGPLMSLKHTKKYPSPTKRNANATPIPTHSINSTEAKPTYTCPHTNPHLKHYPKFDCVICLRCGKKWIKEYNFPINIDSTDPLANDYYRPDKYPKGEQQSGT